MLKKISKYYEEESKKQRKTFNKGKAKKISLGLKMEELENLISNLKETEIRDNPLKGMKNLLHSFEGFLCEISKPEYTPTTYLTNQQLFWYLCSNKLTSLWALEFIDIGLTKLTNW